MCLDWRALLIVPHILSDWLKNENWPFFNFIFLYFCNFIFFNLLSVKWRKHSRVELYKSNELVNSVENQDDFLSRKWLGGGVYVCVCASFVLYSQRVYIQNERTKFFSLFLNIRFVPLLSIILNCISFFWSSVQ